MDPSSWIIIFVGFIVLELITVSLVSIWFAGGALFAALASYFNAPGFLQIIVFVFSSIALLVPLKPWADKKFNKSRVKTNVNALEGKTAVVEEDIDTALNKGKVVVNGMEWSAKTPIEEGKIKKGVLVEILRVEGVKLVVKEKGEII